MIKTNDATTTDRLRRSPLDIDWSPSCSHLLLRSFIRLHGVNHNLPFPTAISLYKIVCTIAILWFFSAFAFGLFAMC